LTHYFFTLLHRKNILLRCFTQNIDTLERLAGLPDDYVVEAHGSFAKSKCLRCKKIADAGWMKEMINKNVIPICASCKIGIVKPCITFFGEALPDKFFLRFSVSIHLVIEK
jgi:NAD-dependent deacetylase sirtuin 2